MHRQEYDDEKLHTGSVRQYSNKKCWMYYTVKISVWRVLFVTIICALGRLEYNLIKNRMILTYLNKNEFIEI